MLFKLIRTNGTIEEVDIPANRDALQALQGYVGGNIEVVYTPNKDVMILNEEGKIDDLPFNAVATAIYGREDDIVGDALVANATEFNKWDEECYS